MGVSVSESECIWFSFGALEVSGVGRFDRGLWRRRRSVQRSEDAPEGSTAAGRPDRGVGLFRFLSVVVMVCITSPLHRCGCPSVSPSLVCLQERAYFLAL